MTRVLAPFGARSVPVVARTAHGPYVVLTVADPAGPRPAAGQFYMLRSTRRWGGGEGERPFLPRAFSVLRAPEDSGQLEFLIEDVGPGTRRLAELGPGEELTVVGPLGHGFEAPRDGRRPVLVGGGVGIAPLAIWRDQLRAGHGLDAVVLLGFRDRRHAAGAALLPGARLATDDGSAGRLGLVTELLEEELGRGRGVEVYACGPPAMLEAARALCAEAGAACQLALESGMACGFGACFGCVVPTRAGYVRLCLEGPVLDAAQLESALAPGAAEIETALAPDTAQVATALAPSAGHGGATSRAAGAPG